MWWSYLRIYVFYYTLSLVGGFDVFLRVTCMLILQQESKQSLNKEIHQLTNMCDCNAVPRLSMLSIIYSYFFVDQYHIHFQYPSWNSLISSFLFFFFSSFVFTIFSSSFSNPFSSFSVTSVQIRNPFSPPPLDPYSVLNCSRIYPGLFPFSLDIFFACSTCQHITIYFCILIRNMRLIFKVCSELMGIWKNGKRFALNWMRECVFRTQVDMKQEEF